MPNDFLPPAERFGLAPAIDRWVVSRAARLARDQRVEVNLSAHSLGDGSLTGFIEAQLEASGADPANLVFEITETAAARDLVQAGKLAERLIALGCGFALDDFGTGYGSFTYLKHLPVELHQDRHAVRVRPRDRRPDRQVVKAIVDVARNFDIKTIAEGVETRRPWSASPGWAWTTPRATTSGARAGPHGLRARPRRRARAARRRGTPRRRRSGFAASRRRAGSGSPESALPRCRCPWRVGEVAKTATPACTVASARRGRRLTPTPAATSACTAIVSSFSKPTGGSEAAPRGTRPSATPG